MIDNVRYNKIEKDTLTYTRDKSIHSIYIDNIIICAGQNSYDPISTTLKENQIKYTIIGGAFKALELDAKHAIKQGLVTALEL